MSRIGFSNLEPDPVHHVKPWPSGPSQRLEQTAAGGYIGTTRDGQIPRTPPSPPTYCVQQKLMCGEVPYAGVDLGASCHCTETFESHQSFALTSEEAAF